MGHNVPITTVTNAVEARITQLEWTISYDESILHKLNVSVAHLQADLAANIKELSTLKDLLITGDHHVQQ